MILVLVGESSCGKTLTSKILNEQMGYHRTVSHTTRPARPNEVNGIDYYFVSQNEFDSMVSRNEFAEYTHHDLFDYGTSKKEIEKFFESGNNCVAVLNPVGFRQFNKLNLQDVFSVYIDVDMRERFIKALQRGDEISEAYRRVNYDAGQFNGIKNEVDLIVENKHYEKSPLEVATIIDSAARTRSLWDSKYTPVAK